MISRPFLTAPVKCWSTSLVPRPTPFFVIRFAFQYNTQRQKSANTERKPKNKKRGRPGNEATGVRPASLQQAGYTDIPLSFCIP